MKKDLKNVLIVTDVSFWVKGAGHRMRIAALAEYLSSRVNLSIAFIGPIELGLEQDLSVALNIRMFVLERSKILSSKGYGRRFEALLKKTSFDTIVIEYIHNTYFLNHIPDGIKVVLDAHDIISNRTEEFRMFNHGSMTFEMSRETEFKIFDVYDYVMVLCEPDHSEIIASIHPEKVLLCPHHVTPLKYRVKKAVKMIGFIASEYLPNVDAIRFFIEHSWPAIYQKRQICLAIYGNINNVVDFSNIDGVVAKGYIADLNQVYQEVDIVINPVRFGAGLKIKTVEALSFGVPLVTTAHGARGLDEGKNKAFLTADGPVEFSGAVLSLIENYRLRQSLSEEAYKFIEARFSGEKCYNPLLNVITEQPIINNYSV